MPGQRLSTHQVAFLALEGACVALHRDREMFSFWGPLETHSRSSWTVSKLLGKTVFVVNQKFGCKTLTNPFRKWA